MVAKIGDLVILQHMLYLKILNADISNVIINNNKNLLALFGTSFSAMMIWLNALKIKQYTRCLVATKETIQSRR